MLKDITLGRYYPSCSSLHRLDPRTKILFLIVYIVSVFFCNSIATCLFSAVVLGALVALSKVPLKYMFRGLRALVAVLVVVALVNTFSYSDGVSRSLIITLRIVEVVVSSNLLTLTTKPKDIADGIEKSLGFLNAVKIPVHDFAAAMAIAVRFIPILTSEANRIIDAQKARGAEFEENNLVKRAKSLLPVLVPLFVSALKKADELSDSMESRLYGTGKPTRLHPLEYSSYDVLSFILTAEYIAVFVLWRILCL